MYAVGYVVYELDIETADWLTFPSQSLLALTAGRVFFDNSGELTALREQLAFYPRDIWLYLLACGWDRLGQEMPLMQRAGYTGDELGSALIGSRLVRDLMALGFLMERQYAPYPKWFGTAFKSLASAANKQARDEAWKRWKERLAAAPVFQPKARYGYFPVRAEGDALRGLHTVDDELAIALVVLDAAAEVQQAAVGDGVE